MDPEAMGLHKVNINTPQDSDLGRNDDNDYGGYSFQAPYRVHTLIQSIKTDMSLPMGYPSEELMFYVYSIGVGDQGNPSILFKGSHLRQCDEVSDLLTLSGLHCDDSYLLVWSDKWDVKCKAFSNFELQDPILSPSDQPESSGEISLIDCPQTPLVEIQFCPASTRLARLHKDSSHVLVGSY
jgi:hypothetical protein